MNSSLPADMALACGARAELRTRVFDYASVTTSTNDRAVELAASGALDGTTVIADRQTAGRGRLGRAWYSPSTVGLYMSVILRPASSPVVTLLAGVAVVEAIRTLSGVLVELKWPNDVVARVVSVTGINGVPQKVAGILAEVIPPESGGGVVLGIGVNVGSGTFPHELEETATSLEATAGCPIDRGSLCADILVRLEDWRSELQMSGTARVIERWRELSPCSCGTHVLWDGSDGPRRGMTAGIDERGALLVTCDGGTERFIGGELVWEF